MELRHWMRTAMMHSTSANVLLASHAQEAALSELAAAVTHLNLVSTGIKALLIAEQPRTCRICGCTDEDCGQCLLATGTPCHWIAKDLCSRCGPVASKHPIAIAFTTPGRDPTGRTKTAPAGRKV